MSGGTTNERHSFAVLLERFPRRACRIRIVATTVEFLCNSPEETEALAHAFAKLLRAGDVVSLEGDLGSGKTFFTRAVARALGYRERVTSPTFVIEKRYPLPQNPHGPTLIVHYDLYRLDSYAELAEIGFEDLPDGAAALVEWGDRFLSELPRQVIRVIFTIVDAASRRLTILCDEERARQLIAQQSHGVVVTSER
jgi:tRNA threonylcarbamoyladenosine biosynthesis protein TsaE